MEVKKEPSEVVRLTTIRKESAKWPDAVPPVIYFPPRKNGRIVKIWAFAPDLPSTTQQTDEINL